LRRRRKSEQQQSGHEPEQRSENGRIDSHRRTQQSPLGAG
jgi:hypothetical protein